MVEMVEVGLQAMVELGAMVELVVGLEAMVELVVGLEAMVEPEAMVEVGL
jgi:hypothetical protein